MKMTIFLDCTPRDGGYYNDWDFSQELIQNYMIAMQSVGVSYVELGLRSIKNQGFKGASAYTTDDYLRSLEVPSELSLGVMVNGAELVGEVPMELVLEQLFPEDAKTSLVKLVRIACHAHEFSKSLLAVQWLKNKGFMVGFNLMQIATRSQSEVEELSAEASGYPIDVLYFADSMGGMTPEDIKRTIGWLRKSWVGPLGIHTHDNLGLALQNTMTALDCGVTWVDSTITGMGRGPGNAKTEQLAIELAERRGQRCNLVPLMSLIKQVFKPMQDQKGWGTNTYYYLAGKYGIHPSYIQQMLGDNRYSEEDILAVIDHLKIEGGKEFSLNTLDAARHFYKGPSRGTWSPKKIFKGREVLLLGSGPGVKDHKAVIESYIKKYSPLVLALNTQSSISQSLIDFRIACHPTRLLADCETHVNLPQPLITPASMLSNDVQDALGGKELLDFGLGVQVNSFDFKESHCVLPISIVVAYALAVVTSGESSRLMLAGFDGYLADDPRSEEMMKLLNLYKSQASAIEVLAITPTNYQINSKSIYALRPEK
jgi:4-hydroxy 2-oxovalerate aldolase